MRNNGSRWHASINGLPPFVGISSTSSRLSWRAPVASLASKTSIFWECWPIASSPEPLPMPRWGTGAILEDQGRHRRGRALHRLALVSFDQTLFVLQACQETHAAQTPHLSVPDLWASDRPGFERRFEPGLVRGRNASPASCVKLAVLGSGYDRDVKCLWSRCETETRGLTQRF